MEVALTYIYGIGKTRAKQILKDSGVSPDTKTDQLADSEISAIRGIIDKRARWRAISAGEISMSIKRLMDIGAYRGLRHRKGLPVRGRGRTPTEEPGKVREGPLQARKSSFGIHFRPEEKWRKQSEKRAREKKRKILRKGLLIFNPLLIIPLSPSRT